MRKLWKSAAVSLVASLALVSNAQAQSCGDLNNDSNFSIVDVILLSQCLVGGGTCPAVSPGPLCSTGSLIDCGDVFGDGDISVAGLTADLGAAALQLANIDTLFAPCEGPGPDVAGCPGAVVLPTTTHTSNVTLPAGCDLTLGGSQFVEAGVTLTIEPGAIVKGDPAAIDPPGIFILPGAKIDAQGTPSAPIILTSAAPAGSRSSGDWGGLNINGRSTVNAPGCTFEAEGLPTPFGGCIEDDFSGIVTFTRVEFAGIDFTPGNELNAITMNGIGSQTQINFTQAHNTNDDCHEWFGGTSNHKNMVSSACGDDSFDCQLGWTGKLQNGVVFQDGTVTDPGRDSRGIECDNSEFGNDNQPRGDATMCNLTIIGSDGQTGANDGTDAGILLRRGVHAQIANTIVQNFGDAGAELRDIATVRDACDDADDNGTPEALTGNTMLRSVVFDSNGSGGTEHAKSGDRLQDDCTIDSECVGLEDPAECCTGPGTGTCGSTTPDADCNCDVPEWYGLLNAAGLVEPANGSSATTTGISNAWPAIDNTICTGAGTPDPCCTGAGAGTCRAVPDITPSFSGTVPAVTDCTDSGVDAGFGDFFDSLAYIGAVDPSAVCTASECDWMTTPWVGFARD